MAEDTGQRRPAAGYVVLVAMLISIGALGTDIMLPALDVIGSELGAGDPNDVHFVVTAFFLGMAAGQLFVGPLSDSLGRKPLIYAGYGVFVIGCVISMTTEDWTTMLAGRVLQGFGAAAPRVVTVALVRDEYAGRAMARVMSIVMAAFIIVPIVAPALGQGLIHLGGWRATYIGLAVLGIAVSLWFAARQPETLAPANRRPFRIGEIWKGVREIVGTRAAFGYTIATGLMYGVFVGYLGSAQQIFEITFGVGDLFVVYFAVAAASLGVASLVNASLVMRLGMRRLTGTALSALTALSFGFLLLLPVYDGVPPLPMFLAWQLSAFFCVGIIFGNLNALALEPLGHMAGLGAAFVGSIATFISLPLASTIGQFFDGTVLPLVGGFASLGLASFAVVLWTNRGRPRREIG
jgi:DHA1 family bicyclomycin/chloramphenicol resistance-like MFS transporter